MSLLFQRLFNDAHHDSWNEFELPKLTVAQIRFLCMSLGAPKSGTKEKVIVRLLAVRQVRLSIAKYSTDESGIALLIAENCKERLHWMAKQAGLWRSGNKRQLAVVLLNWRERCRISGRKVYDEARAFTIHRPRQLTLDL